METKWYFICVPVYKVLYNEFYIVPKKLIHFIIQFIYLYNIYIYIYIYIYIFYIIF